MVVVDSSEKSLVSPPADWGVAKRSYVLRDFKALTWFTVLALMVSPLLFVPSLADFQFFVINDKPVTVYDVSLFFFVPLVLGVLFSLYSAVHRPAEEALQEARSRSAHWQRNILIPFLEKRYGLKFKDTNLFGTFHPEAYYQGQLIKVRLTSGVTLDYSNTFDADRYVKTFTVEGDIRIDQVIEPEKVSYSRLDPVV